MEVTEFWNGLLSACRPGSPPLGRVPSWVLYALAYVLETLFAFTCGWPNPHASVWNLTSAALGYTTTTLVGDGSDSQHLLAYWPLYSNAESFQHIKGVMFQHIKDLATTAAAKK